MVIRKTHRLIAFVAIVAVSFAFRGVAPANFAGTWKLNESKSELGQFGARGAAGKVVIEQKEEAIKMAATGASQSGGEETVTYDYADGKEVESSMGFMKRKASLKWADDKQSFTVTLTLSGDFGGQSFSMNGTEVWTVSADGKTLTDALTLSTPQGEVALKIVYDKE